jgi:DNA polymerase III subunit chi
MRLPCIVLCLLAYKLSHLITYTHLKLNNLINHMTIVSFLTVKDNLSKISRVCALVNHLFQLEKKTVIYVPNVEVAKYIDAMLWKYPENSFTPHKISNSIGDETIIITTTDTPFKDVTTLINLCPNIHPHLQHFSTIYELYDNTHPSKEELAKTRIEAYKNKGITPQFL